MNNPPIPGTLEDLSLAVSQLGRMFEHVYQALQDNTLELQRLRLAYDQLSDHCAILAESLWSTRGRNEDLERQVEWFRQLADSREERMRRDTPVEGLPPDTEEG